MGDGGPHADGDGSSVLLEVPTALGAVVALVSARRLELDALNVFPVPDADTGDNALATLRAAHDAVRSQACDDAGEVASEAAVRAARGNSGVVLAQVLRALLDGARDVVGADLAARLARADRLARAAVAQPVEGSILSALTGAAEAAAAAAGRGAGPLDQLQAARDAAHEQVRISPARNEVLARAGVVDAGARAFALVLEAMLAAVTAGEPAPPPVEVPRDGPASVTCTPDGGRYEVMFLLEVPPQAAGAAADAGPAPTPAVAHTTAGPDRGGASTGPATATAVAGATVDAVAAALGPRLGAIGDSVAVVPGRRVVSAHVHTDDVGAALEAALPLGRPSDVRVEDLHASVAATRGDAPTAGPVVLVGAEAEGLREFAVEVGAQVLPLDEHPCTAAGLAAALAVRAAAGPVLLLPGRPDVVALLPEVLAPVADAVGDDRVRWVGAADGPASAVAALVALGGPPPSHEALTAAVEAATTTELPVDGPEPGDDATHPGGAALADAVVAVVESAADGPAPELVTLLPSARLGAALVDDLVARLEERLPDVEVDVLPGAVLSGLHVLVE